MHTISSVALVQLSSVSQSCPTLRDPLFATAACEASLSVTNSGVVQTHVHHESVMPSNHLILCGPLLLLHSIFLSIEVFSKVNSSHQVVKVLEFQLQHKSFQLISRTDFLFSIDWFDLLAVQGTLKSLLQYHRSKASILQHLAFFIVQLSHLYMTTGKKKKTYL